MKKISVLKTGSCFLIEEIFGDIHSNHPTPSEIHTTLTANRCAVQIQTYWNFMDRVDALLAMPHYVRTIRTVVYMLLLIHVNACAYYAVSVWEGIATNGWVFDGIGNP